MRNTRIGALLASTALASATILGGAGIASAEESGTDAITGGAATVTATANDNCEVTFAFADDIDDDLLDSTNWVVDYRVDGEEPTIPNYTDESEEDLDEQLSVFRPVVASNQGSVDALNDHEQYDYDVDLLDKTVNLNDVIEPNDSGEHTVTFKFYRGTADWHSEENQGEVTVTGCDTAGGEGLIGSIVGSVDVFGSLEGMS